MKSKQITLLGKEYLLFENGDIINLKNNKKLNPYSNGVGYLRIGVYVGNKKHKCFYMHRLLASAFLDNPYDKKEVNHIDGNTMNNSLNNLEWVTKSENGLHAYKIGLNKPTPSLGEKNGNSVLNDELVKSIRTMFSLGVKQCDIVKKLGINKYLVSSVVLNKTWKHIKI